MKKTILMSIILGLLTIGNCYAADELRVATGQKGKGYSKIFEELNEVCGNEVTLEEIESKGSLDNVDKLVTNEADVGFIQLDTMYQMMNSDDQVRKLRTVASMHTNLLHILTLTNGTPIKQLVNNNKEVYEIWKDNKKEVIKNLKITKFSQLRGMKVGLVGTSQIIVRKLNGMMNYGLQTIDYEKDDDAIAALKEGKIMAVFTVAAFPHGIINKLTTTNGMSLIPYDLIPPQPYELSKKSYSKLGAYGIGFLSSRNMLMSRNFSGNKAKVVQKLKQCISKNLNNFKDNYSPAWSEIDSLNNYYNLPQAK
jgi:TRAP-type uncharacterized transport system substrate-binding protein